MKKLICISLILLTCFYSHSQVDNPFKHEIDISAGVLPSTDSRMFVDVLVAVLTFGLVVPEQMHTYGSYSIDYYYHTTSKFAYGLNFGYSANSSTYKSGYDNINYKRENFRNYFYLMPSAKLTWYNGNKWSWYSSLSLGGYFRYEKITPKDSDTEQITHNNGFMPAFQLTPIGFQLGNDRFKFFAQLGFGNIGMISAGLSTRF